MKNVWYVAIGLLLLLAVVGCTSTPPASNTKSISENEIYPVYQIRLEDGRKLDCVYIAIQFGNESTGGPSCDWENAK